MTEQEQQRACAELDGWTIILSGTGLITFQKVNVGGCTGHIKNAEAVAELAKVPNYDTYNAIIPLIQKQNHVIKGVLWVWMQENAPGIYAETPAQLREALLRATGKWKD